MTKLQKLFTVVILSVSVLSMTACNKNEVGNVVNKESAAFVEDMGTAFDDSGLDTVAGAVDNLLVGKITGQDYTQ